MAKKKTEKGDGVDDLDLDLNMDDLGGDMDFDDPSFDDDERAPSKSEVVKGLAKDAGSSFIESMTKKTAAKALPPEYEANVHELMDIGQFTGDVLDRNKTKLDKSILRLGKEVQKLIPMQIGILDNYLARKEEEFSELRSQSEEEMRSNAIASEVGSIFDKQLEISKAIEAKRTAENNVESKERMVGTKLTIDMLRSIDHHMAVSSAFETQISKEYFRKSLELQFKSVFIQGDMLRTMRDHYKAFNIQFTNIEKNTGLPEFVKLKSSERLQEVLRTNAIQAVYSRMFDRNRYLQTVKDRVGRAVDDKVNSISDSMNEFTDILSMMNDGGKGAGLRAMGSIAAGMGGDVLGEKAAGWISPKLRDRLKDNKYLNTGANYLSAFASSPATLLRDLRDRAAAAERDGDGGIRTKLFGLARAGLDLTGEERPDIGVKTDSYLTHNQPAIFDMKVHRSISEVIPLFLGKILKQNTDLTSMFYSANSEILGSRHNAPELIYDYEARKLSTTSAVMASVQESVFKKKSAKEKTKNIASNALSVTRLGVSNNKDLDVVKRKHINKQLTSKASQDLLSDYFDKASQTSAELSYDNLINNYDKDLNLVKLVENNPDLRKLLEIMSQNSSKDTRHVDSALSDVNNAYPIEALKTLFKDTSKLAGSKTPNIISDKNASLASKAFSRFIMNRGEDVTPTSVTNRSALSFFKNEEMNSELQTNLAIFVADVRRIDNLGEQLVRSSLLALFGLLNSSLKENLEIDPSVFTNIRNLYPDFVRNKTLTIENIAEGKLTGGDKVEDYFNISDMRELTTMSSKDLPAARESIFVTSGLQKISDTIRNKTSGFSDGLKANSGSITQLTGFLLGEAKSFQSTVAGVMKTKADEVQKGFTRIGQQVDEMVKTGAAKAFPAAIRELTVIEGKLDEYIRLTQDDLDQRMTELEKVRTAVTEVDNSGKMQKLAVRELELFIKMGNQSIKSMASIRSAISASRARLTQESQNTSVAPTEVIKKIGQELKTVLSKAQEQLTKIEETIKFNKTVSV